MMLSGCKSPSEGLVVAKTGGAPDMPGRSEGVTRERGGNNPGSPPGLPEKESKGLWRQKVRVELRF